MPRRGISLISVQLRVTLVNRQRLLCRKVKQQKHYAFKSHATVSLYELGCFSLPLSAAILVVIIY